MKTYFFLLLVLTSLSGFSQSKMYKINKVLWQYEKPQLYTYRVDNFQEATALATGTHSNSETTQTNPDKERVLVAASLLPEDDMNIAIASFKGKATIEKYTVKGWAQKMVGYLKETYENMEKEVTLSVQEATIDTIKFYVVRNKIKSKENGRIYWTALYIGEVGNAEFNFSMAYDKEEQGKMMEQSFLASKFTVVQ